MAQDEGRFGRINICQRCWAPSQIRPEVGQQIVRKYVYGYAAVCPQLGKMTAMILPYADTEMMNIFLEQVSRDFYDYYVVMLVDRAPWHRSHSLEIPENICLIKQPSKSPELNPVEHIWDDIREKEFGNVICRSIDHVTDILTKGFKRLINNCKYLKSLTNFPYLNVSF